MRDLVLKGQITHAGDEQTQRREGGYQVDDIGPSRIPSLRSHCGTISYDLSLSLSLSRRYPRKGGERKGRKIEASEQRPCRDGKEKRHGAVRRLFLNL